MHEPIIRRYVALGDSLTEGISDWGRGDLAIGFAYILANLLRKRSPDLEFTNLGVGGARVADVLRHQLGPAVALAPDLLTLVVGANDVPNTSVTQFERDYAALISGLRAGPTGVIAIATIPDFGHLLPPQYAEYRTLLRERLRAFNRIIAENATVHNVLLVDLQDSPAAADPRNLSSDGFHPNARGYRALAAAFVETLNQAGFDLVAPPLDPD